MTKTRLFVVGILLTTAVVCVCLRLGMFQDETEPQTPPTPPRTIGRTVPVAAGTFRMGNELAASPDQQPVHEVFVDRFFIDEHEVTNRQFSRFVAQTGYLTTAEQRGWSYVFDKQEKRWKKTSGADWRHPEGPDSSLVARDDYPVVHVSWHDATAYARWSGKQLPSEAQWERAARGGLRDANYPWGKDELVDGQYRANYRQHGKHADADGYERAAPVKSYSPNPFGLYDMSGNVWEWCADWYDADYYWSSEDRNPGGPAAGTGRVIRGGSWLSPEDFRLGHHVSTRDSRPPEQTHQHLGFRCVRRQELSTR